LKVCNKVTPYNLDNTVILHCALCSITGFIVNGALEHVLNFLPNIMSIQALTVLFTEHAKDGLLLYM